jgi:hypothetical protein
MTPNGKYKASCRICGKTVTEFPILNIPIIGEPDAKATQVMTIMGRHIAIHHGEQFGAGLQLSKDFQAFLILSQFECNDPSVQARAEAIRAGMQALTRKFTISDQQLRDGIVALDSEGQLNAETVIQFIKEIRDVLIEQGQYAPQIEQKQSSLIV